jgi:hypothetical protein
MRPDNRYVRVRGFSRTPGQRMNSKMAVVAIIRRCEHQRVALPRQLHRALRRELPRDCIARTLALQTHEIRALATRLQGLSDHFLRCPAPGARFFAPPGVVCFWPGARSFAPPGVVCVCPGVAPVLPGAVADFPLVCPATSVDSLPRRRRARDGALQIPYRFVSILRSRPQSRWICQTSLMPFAADSDDHSTATLKLATTEFPDRAA